MKISPLKYSAWTSLLLIVLTSCHAARVNGPDENARLHSDASAASQPEKMSFKTDIQWGERELSGQMLVKKVDDGNLRIAFYNEFGMTFLEGTLDRTSRNPKLIVINIAPIIDYQPFIKNFKKCIVEIFDSDDFNETTDPLTGLVKNSITVELHNGFNMKLTTTNDQ